MAENYTNSTELRNSRYVQGGTTDIYSTRLGWWERRVIPKANDDVTVTVLSNEAGRPDLIAYRLYQKANLGWLVLEFNNIVDPVIELTTGTKIIMPSQRRLLLDVLTKPIGGNEITS